MVRVESNNSGAESDEEHSENPKSSCISKYTVTASKVRYRFASDRVEYTIVFCRNSYIRTNIEVV